jgi:hypothetical protein
MIDPVTQRQRIQLAAFAAFATVAVGGTVLAGCGSGGGNIPNVAALNGGSATGGGGQYIGRSFNAGSLSLGANRSGVLSISVLPGGSATGLLTVSQTGSGVIGTIPLRGTVNPATGQFNLTGSGDLSGQATAVNLAGSLPQAGASSGGSVSVGLGGSTFQGQFTSASGSPSPNPGGTPAPNPSGTPTPNPTSSPGTGNRTLGSFFTSQNTTGSFTYRDTTTTTSPNFLTGQNETQTTTDTYTVQNKNLFASGRVGQSTQVTLATAQGNVTVTRQELLDEQTGAVTGFSYFTQDSSSYTLYGSDTLDTQRRVTTRSRYNPPLRWNLGLRVGESSTNSTQVTTETLNPANGAVTSTQVFNQTFTVTFVAIESVTVPAGTFSETARVKTDFSFTIPAQGGSSAVTSTSSSTAWTALNLATVRSSSTSNTSTTIPDPNNPGQTRPFNTSSATESVLISFTP